MQRLATKMMGVVLLSAPVLAAMPVLAAPPATALPGSKPRLADLTWMAGAWSGDEQGVAVQEFWTGPDGGMMLSVHKDVKNGRVTDWELLRIEEQSDGIVLLASPRGAPATPFRLVEIAGERVVFANPAHDYPKRILYWRTGDGALHAAIDGGEGTERMEWRWTRAR
ncbi:MAG TPA: DUF6265 family protein [Candidatus Polarisedimenticolia bacterium]|nr:DUF6265 family protein [Candidatus Polarisedimenticolia bacterium]